MWTYGDFDPVIKCCLIALAICVAVKCSPGKMPFVRKIKITFRKQAARPWRFAILLVAITFAINALMSLIFYPEPRVHDEFAYLLASDTFANGRLTNPQHRMWEHFETFHVLSTPSNQAKYPPANGLILGLGQLLTGHALFGVWISYALACLALLWMLRAWTSPQWAAMGALLFAINGPLLRAWGQTYWGGCIALMAGALVFGGLKRICDAGEKTPRTRDAVLLGIGLVALANSRPMEGFLVFIPVVIVMLCWFFRNRELTWTSRSLRVAMPIVLTGIAGLACMGIYNKAVTGDYFTMPYSLHDGTYSASSLLIWKSPDKVPEYNHPRMEKFYREFGRDRQLGMQSISVYSKQLMRKLRLLWNYLPLGIGLSLIPAFLLWKDPWWRLAISVMTMLLLIHSQMSASWIYPHYIAPALALFFALNIQCLRQLRIWHRQHHWGQTLVRAIVVLTMMKLVPTLIIWSVAPIRTPRAEIEERLAKDSGATHLVICSYGDDYPIVSDWVYNLSDIDGSNIVWARDMGEEKNAELVKYYANRKIWRCHFENDETMNLTPQTSETTHPSTQFTTHSKTLPETELDRNTK